MVKPGNAAKERWHGARGERAPLAILYLHGFSASPGEVGDLPEQMAQALGANLYMPLWPGHGEDAPKAMRGLTADALEASAWAALDHACAMGEAVAIVGCSLGATLGLRLAAARPADVVAVVAWSPGVQPAAPALLDRLCAMSEAWASDQEQSSAVRAYWSEAVHPDWFKALRETFRRCAAEPPWPQVKCPVFLGYYRGPDGREDPVASVPAMLAMFDALGSRAEQKRAHAFAADAHAIGSPHKTRLAGAVVAASVEFLREMLAGTSPRRST